ncbi:MAG: citrate synthase [Bacteroidetes bacterium]|nr:citrate synthase [Bacteroidota bacterium]
MAEDKALIKVNGKEIELPLVKGTEEEIGIDISSLRSASGGVVTLDPGYKNTGATESAITFLDGDKGILSYRGYSIEELAEKSNFVEVQYLLLNGELPNKTQYEAFEKRLTEHSLVHEDMKKFFDGYPSHSHPMGQLGSMICALSAFYPNSLDPNRPESDREKSMMRLLAKMPTIVAMIYKNYMGHPYIYPNNSLGYVENFMNMTFGMPTQDTEIDPVIVDAMDKLLILHADHEQNCSTSTVRMVGSSHANLYASVSSGISALWGPLHGGANQKVLEMLDMIIADGGNIEKYVAKAKDKDDPFKLFGFGHRVYKNFDPRARIIKKASDNVLGKLGINDPALDVAKKLEAIALEDDYFVSRKLYPNVDFYSGIIYKAMGFPTQMFTVLFALGRLPGWIAQWKEMRDTKQPIGRPRQIYTGQNARPFVEMSKR